MEKVIIDISLALFLLKILRAWGKLDIAIALPKIVARIDKNDILYGHTLLNISFTGYGL
jgi:hypothetical protein